MTDTFTRDPLPRIQYQGDGITTVFSFPFAVLISDDLLVYLDHAPATGYVVNGLGNPAGGDVTFAVAPAAGSDVTLLRRTESIRESAFVDGGPFRAAAVNAELDRLVALIQEGREEHGRALRVHPAESTSDFCLPAISERAESLLGFDADGAPIAVSPGPLEDFSSQPLTRLHTLTIAQDAAASFAPQSSIGIVQMFGHGDLADPSAAVFSYRADASGYVELLAGVATVEVLQQTALTGTSGNGGVVTVSAHSDGRIYVENRLAGADRTISLNVVGVRL